MYLFRGEGGDVLYVEAIASKGKGGLQLTGTTAADILNAGDAESSVHLFGLAGNDLLLTTAPCDWPGHPDPRAVLVELLRARAPANDLTRVKLGTAPDTQASAANMRMPGTRFI